MPVDSSAAYIPLDGSSRSGCWGHRSTLERSFIFVIAFLAILTITLSIALVYKKCDDSHVTTIAPNVTTPTPKPSPKPTTPPPHTTTHNPKTTTIQPTQSPNTTVHPSSTPKPPPTNGTSPKPTPPPTNGTSPKTKSTKLTVVSTTLDFQPNANEDNLTTDAIIDEPKS